MTIFLSITYYQLFDFILQLPYRTRRFSINWSGWFFSSVFPPGYEVFHKATKMTTRLTGLTSKKEGNCNAMVTWSRLYVNSHVIPISSYPSLSTKLTTKLPIPFILQSYCLFHNTMMSDLLTNQPAVEVIAVAGRRSVSSPEGHGPT